MECEKFAAENTERAMRDERFDVNIEVLCVIRIRKALDKRIISSY